MPWWLEILNFKFDQKKVKVWLVWTVDFLPDDSKFPLSVNQGIGDVLSQEIRSRWCIRDLEIMPQAIRSCPEQKVNGTLSSVKTLIWSIQKLWAWWNEFEDQMWIVDEDWSFDMNGEPNSNWSILALMSESWFKTLLSTSSKHTSYVIVSDAMMHMEMIWDGILGQKLGCDSVLPLWTGSRPIQKGTEARHFWQHV